MNRFLKNEIIESIRIKQCRYCEKKCRAEQMELSIFERVVYCYLSSIYQNNIVIMVQDHST